MKKFLVLTVLLWLPMLASAQDRPVPLSERPNIAVQGDAEVMVEPDYAVVKLAVQHVGAGVVAVRDDNQAALTQLLADARGLGIAAADLSTTPSMVFPGRWQCSTCSDAEKQNGYTAHASLTITLRDLATLPDLIARVSSDQHVMLQDVEYHTTALRQHRDRARALAMQAARQKAQALSGEIGQSIGKALSISERASSGDGYWSWSQWGYSCCGYYSSRSGWNSSAMSQNVSVVAEPSAGAGAGGGPVAPGRIAVRAGVSVTFELL